MSGHLLEVRGLSKYFPVGRGTLKAVDDVTFHVDAGETLGIVGESGCGKTTCGRTVAGLYAATAGTVRFDGRDVTRLRGRERRDFTKHVQVVFQDPYSSLDPHMKVGDIVAEGMLAHGIGASREDRAARVCSLLESVGLESSYAERYIHELSGGQRQRVGIARALAVDPELLILDEPISALDVSIQAQVVTLLERLQRERGLTYVFIAHDLAMVRHISDRVLVMYLGRMVEEASVDELFDNPMHPYTKALLSSIPIPDPRVGALKNRIRLEGEIPSPIDPAPGCRFAGRCFCSCEVCDERDPAMAEVSPGHFVLCHRCGSDVC